MIKKITQIGATIGPSCATSEILVDMINSGMNFARLNFSHGTHEEHAELIKAIRAAEKITGESVLIMQDLQGPKIRVGIMPEAGLEVAAEETVVFNTELDTYNGQQIPVDFPGLATHLKAGEHILIDDGRMEVRIVRIESALIFAEVIQGHTLLSHKGLNFPDSHLAVAPLSEKDKIDLRFGVAQKVDLLALSFVTTAEDILHARTLIQEYEAELTLPKRETPIRIIAKIERREAVKNIAEILKVADGVMVARGDLGLETPEAEVPLIQKRIIKLAHAAGKPVTVATQLLDSMQNSIRPTRAEVSDVANAVIDGADALLLTNETAAGEYPALTVKTMAGIIVATEHSEFFVAK